MCCYYATEATFKVGVMQFARLYPLNQLDLPVEKKHVDFGPLLGSGVKVENPSRDYTPPSKH